MWRNDKVQSHQPVIKWKCLIRHLGKDKKWFLWKLQCWVLPLEWDLPPIYWYPPRQAEVWCCCGSAWSGPGEQSLGWSFHQAWKVDQSCQKGNFKLFKIVWRGWKILVGNDESEKMAKQTSVVWDLREILSRHQWRNIELWALRPDQYWVNF